MRALTTMHLLWRAVSFTATIYFFFQPAAAYKILLMPLQAKSHVYTMVAIADEMVQRGHQATILLNEQFPLNVHELRNRADIRIVRYTGQKSGSSANFEESFENLSLAMMEQRKDDSFFIQMASDIFGSRGENRGWLQRLTEILADQCRQLTMNSEDVLERLDKERFDIAIVDVSVFSKCLLLVPHRLRIPWVSVALQVNAWIVRTPWLPSFVPHLGTPYTEKMTFGERLLNTVFNALAFRLNVDAPADVTERYRTYGSFADLEDLIGRSVLYLIPQDQVLEYAKPMMPNIINVGGLTIKNEISELPVDMKSFIDGAKRGVILISFGTLAFTVPGRIVEKFASVFRHLDDYRFIWRLNNKDKVEIPDNVMITSWLPQNDLLAHPKVKLFITHCGNNGQFEAVYHGVPMIGFPLLGDQIFNARRIEYKGYGKSMKIASFTSDELLENIREVSEDPGYSQRVKKASEIFRSQPQKPAERAAFWIEHVCRFGGEHLKSAGNDLALYEYLMLDIMALFLLILFFTVFAAWTLFSFVFRKCSPLEKRKGKLE